MVVGAPEENGSATGVNGTLDERALAAGAGAAYVFVRNGTTWSQEAYLKPAAVGTRQGGTISANRWRWRATRWSSGPPVRTAARRA